MPRRADIEGVSSPIISIRPATAGDGRTLMRLAALDSARALPFGPALIAEIDGEPKAALSLRDDRVVADPFTRTAGVVELLRVHARAISEHDELAEARPAFGGALRFAA
jgi:hypothetical protein